MIDPIKALVRGVHGLLSGNLWTMRAVSRINRKLERMQMDLDEIIAKQQEALTAIARNRDLDQSIIGLVQRNTDTIKALHDQLAAAGTDPVKLATIRDNMQAIIDQETAAATQVADAVTANTPAS